MNNEDGTRVRNSAGLQVGNHNIQINQFLRPPPGRARRLTVLVASMLVLTCAAILLAVYRGESPPRSSPAPSAANLADGLPTASAFSVFDPGVQQSDISTPSITTSACPHAAKQYLTSVARAFGRGDTASLIESLYEFPSQTAAHEALQIDAATVRCALAPITDASVEVAGLCNSSYAVGSREDSKIFGFIPISQELYTGLMQCGRYLIILVDESPLSNAEGNFGIAASIAARQVSSFPEA